MFRRQSNTGGALCHRPVVLRQEVAEAVERLWKVDQLQRLLRTCAIKPRMPPVCSASYTSRARSRVVETPSLAHAASTRATTKRCRGPPRSKRDSGPSREVAEAVTPCETHPKLYQSSMLPDMAEAVSLLRASESNTRRRMSKSLPPPWPILRLAEAASTTPPIAVEPPSKSQDYRAAEHERSTLPHLPATDLSWAPLPSPAVAATVRRAPVEAAVSTS